MRFKILLSLAINFVIASNALAVTYKVTFTGTWSPSDVEPGTYPGSAHFSDLIGATHTQGTQFWQSGGTASAGVEAVAELGFNGTLESELRTMQQAGNTGDTIVFSSLFGLPNSDTVEIEVSDDKPYISLISMIAPSPDWFVGVSGLSLQNNGQWLESIKVDLVPYDAGTEEGNTFSLSNPATPSGVIARLSGDDSPFIGQPVVATLEFTLLSPPSPPQPPSPPPTTPSDGASKALTAIFSLLLDSDDEITDKK